MYINISFSKGFFSLPPSEQILPYLQIEPSYFSPLSSAGRYHHRPARNKGFTVQPSPSPSSILSSPSSKVGAHSEGQVKIYELLDPLELEKWQLQISNKIAMQTKEFGYDPKVNGILACQWNVQDLIYSFLCIDEDMKLYISKWNAG
ncbi:Uncharacterized protein Fot_37569 [Forsythia ovata]|uniref:Uncharacterized protein n=1 Tax=Forsythia ovata TaxID=205694 RepID=A0ABD1RZC8_9LAMI